MADFLVERHGFQQLYLRKTNVPEFESATFDFADERAQGSSRADEGDRYPFPDAAKLLEFVTGSWHELWVTIDIWDEDVLDAFIRRPFFLLVSIDAPVSTRWERFAKR